MPTGFFEGARQGRKVQEPDRRAEVDSEIQGVRSQADQDRLDIVVLKPAVTDAVVVVDRVRGFLRRLGQTKLLVRNRALCPGAKNPAGD